MQQVMAMNKRAFTLLEILLALSLLSVLSTFVFGWLVHSQQHIRESHQALETKRSLFQAVMLMRQDLLHQVGDNPLQIAEETLTLQTHFHTITDPRLAHQVTYQIENEHILRQINQDAPRLLCAFPQTSDAVTENQPALFIEEDGVLFLQISETELYHLARVAAK